MEDRKQKGFNVIQVMLLHELSVVNKYGDSALNNKNVATPKTTAGNLFSDIVQYDFWDHVDYVIKLAATKGIYMALVPVWGGNVKGGGVTAGQVKIYSKFLTDRLAANSNIIWLNGGDIKGTDSMNVWNMIGSTLKANDTRHLITFHPRGRETSSKWFHNATWLDFNMFQSGHKDYAQDTTEPRIGEDNWKFAENDYALKPTKPTMDGEPSYEGIPHGLHSGDDPYWNKDDVRRYAYWSVFSGGAGFTYGHNAVMQFYKKGDPGTSYFPKMEWQEALMEEGASQMEYLKNLLLSKTYLDRVPDQSMIIDNGSRYNRVVATRATGYAMFYTYTGAKFKVQLGKINGDKLNASWYDPKTAKSKVGGKITNKGVKTFDPPGDERDGNDWVLVLEAIGKKG